MIEEKTEAFNRVVDPQFIYWKELGRIQSFSLFWVWYVNLYLFFAFTKEIACVI